MNPALFKIIQPALIQAFIMGMSTGIFIATIITIYYQWRTRRKCYNDLFDEDCYRVISVQSAGYKDRIIMTLERKDHEA